MDEKFLELAETMARQARDDQQQAIQRQLAQAGSADCEDCGDPIPDARRRAAPWAVRCTPCQSAFERLLTVNGKNHG